MTAPAHNTGGPTAQSLTVELRHFLSRRLISRVVEGLGLGEMFLQSQSWEGYDLACESWHSAYWKWVEDEVPFETVRLLRAGRGDWSKLSVAEILNHLKANGVDCSKLPNTEAERQEWLDELFRQEYLQQVSVFYLAMRGPEATDPETYGLFSHDFLIAAGIGDDSYFRSLAKQKQRKPSKDQGDRRLKAQLLVYWIPGCLWALTTDGIAAFLQAIHPRSTGRPYDPKTISDAWRELDLYRLPKPLWWGIAGQPPRLVQR